MENEGSRLGLFKSGTDIKTGDSKFKNDVPKNNSEAYYTKDNRRRYTFVNSAYCDLAGVRESNIIGKTDEDLALNFLYEKNMEYEMRVLEGKHVHLSNVRLHAKEDLFHDICFNPVYDSDDITVIYGVKTNIVE